MKYPLYYAHAKLKAVKGKRLQGNTGILHLSFVRWNLLKKKTFNYKVKRKRADQGIVFALNSIKYKNKIRIGSFYICCVCNRLLYKGSVHIFGKANTRVKIFSVCSLHLMENSIFVKHVT